MVSVQLLYSLLLPQAPLSLPQYHLLRKKHSLQAQEPDMSLTINKTMNGALLPISSLQVGLVAQKLSRQAAARVLANRGLSRWHQTARLKSLDSWLILKRPGEKGPTFFETILRSATIRGLQGGSREQFDKVGRVIESRDIKPAIDLRIFQLAGLKVAYQYLWDWKQARKVVVS